MSLESIFDRILVVNHVIDGFESYRMHDDLLYALRNDAGWDTLRSPNTLEQWHQMFLDIKKRKPEQYDNGIHRYVEPYITPPTVITVDTSGFILRRTLRDLYSAITYDNIDSVCDELMDIHERPVMFRELWACINAFHVQKDAGVFAWRDLGHWLDKGTVALLSTIDRPYVYSQIQVIDLVKRVELFMHKK